MGSRHNSLIDLYRFIFAIMIVSSHAVFLRDKGIPFAGGYSCVEFFFILSGFLLAQTSSTKNDNGENYILDTVETIKKRVINMLFYCIPAFFVSFIVLEYPYGEISLKYIFEQLLASIWELLFIEMSGIGARQVAYIGTLWFFSAMIINIIWIYPMLRKFKNNFSCLIAPLIVLMSYGYHSVKFGSLSDVNTWVGFTYSGVIRAAGGMCLGCIIHSVYIYI